jgi:hypothetical protein
VQHSACMRFVICTILLMAMLFLFLCFAVVAVRLEYWTCSEL